MNSPIIITAFGTTSKAIATYTHLENAIRPHFPKNEIIWAYSSRVVGKELKKTGNRAALHPEEVLKSLLSQKTSQVIVQSLHLFPGTEFHSLQKTVRASRLNCSLGLPLFTSFQDYLEMSTLLETVILSQPDRAVLILGHGTHHPSWTAYYSLEKVLRQKYGSRVFVGTVEPFPDSSHLVNEIASFGFKEVCIIPFFLVAGFHFRRDIIGEGSSTWKSQFRAKSIAVSSIDHGIGLLPGIEKIIVRHIQEAGAKFTKASLL